MSTADEKLRLLNTPDKIAEAGEGIYSDLYKTELEAKHFGEFVAIDVLTNKAYVAQFPEKALQEARTAAPRGLFHLIKIGARGAFKVSYVTHDGDRWGWLLRPAR